METSLPNDAAETDHSLTAYLDIISTSAVFHRDLCNDPVEVIQVRGDYQHLADGRRIYNASGGAAVTPLGGPYPNAPTDPRHTNMERIKKALLNQFDLGPFISSSHFRMRIIDEACEELLRGTGGEMKKACIFSSGTEAVATAIKLVLQYWRELVKPEYERVNFIGRLQSYHGTSLETLALGHHGARRLLFEDVLARNYHHVEPCNEYRGRAEGESTESYVARLAQGLRDKIEELGPHTVAAFVAEPVVGAALGCAPAVPGYFEAMKEVCDSYGILIVFDEIMCGMGRTGTLHAWQQEGIVPDIEIIGKGLAAGVTAASAVLSGPKVVNAIGHGSGLFSHGHTYQSHPLSCALVLEVQRIIREQGLVENNQRMGDLMYEMLKDRLHDHRHVGDIRGKGGFRGIEFVLDRKTKTSFPRENKIVERFHEFAMQEPYCIYVYPGTGWGADGIEGEGIILAPSYHVTEEEIGMIVNRTVSAIEDFFLFDASAKL